MTKISVQVENELVKVLKGLKETSFLEQVRNDMISKLSNKIDSNIVKSIFDLESGIDKLNETEAKTLFNEIYLFSKVEKLNPESALKIKKPDYFYNEELKESFLSEKNYKESTADAVRIIFNRVATIEKELDKDLYNFNKNELEKAFTILKAKTVRSLQNYISKIKLYIDFANELNGKEVNLAKDYSTKKQIESFLNQDAQDNMIFDKDAIMEMASFADNAQDGVILALLFDGLSYRDKYTELVELTEEMIDLDNNSIHLPARQEGDTRIEPRTIKISNETKKLIKSAINDSEYVSINGESSRTYKIADSNHILRGVRKGREKINWRNINQRILRISEINDEEYLNATTISYSGQLHCAKEMINEGHPIENTVTKVLRRFGLPINTSSSFYLKSRIEKYLKL